MKKPAPSKTQAQVRQAQTKQAATKLKPTYYILLFAYLLIPAYTPNFYTLDTNGPKFLAIAILNLISLFVLLNDKDFRQRPELQSGFFRNLIGLAYSLFLIISLVSFTQAYNIHESILNFAKLFSVFASAYMLYVIFSSNRGYILHLALAIVFLLLFDCLTVLYHISQYVGLKVDSIYDIKSVYSHKNILTASLFVKMPAVLWLIIFYDGWKARLGYLALLLASLSVLFMSTRAFYIGLALLLFALVAFFIVRHIVYKKGLPVRKMALIIGAFVVSFVIFTLVQRFLYPTNEDTKLKFNTGFVERLSTIKADESSTNARLSNWKRSGMLIKQHPLLGVGSGNWKIEILKYESPTTDNFIISYKNHNDFIEVTAETGILGGLLYLMIFVFIMINFLRSSLTSKADEEQLKYLFLPAFGILAYSVDAFFNFPNDRPEIQALFALYIGMAVAFSNTAFGGKNQSDPKTAVSNTTMQKYLPKAVLVLAVLMLGACAVILSMSVKSLRYQRYVFEDMKGGKYSYKSDFLIQKFPPVPNVSSTGAPISTYIAYYTLNENLLNETTKMLINDNPTPYDSRREYYLSMAYDKLGKMDSTIYWGKKVCELKPRLVNMAFVLTSRLLNAGRTKEALEIIQHFLDHEKNNPDAWLQAADIYMNLGEGGKAILVLDSASVYLPGNEKITNQMTSIKNAEYIKPYEALYNQANQAFSQQRYPEALKLFNDFISKKPDLLFAYQNRAMCLYRTGDYSRSLLDIEKAYKKGASNEAFLINLRGVNKISLGRTDEACTDFKTAMEKGDKDGIINYQRFCEQKK